MLINQYVCITTTGKHYFRQLLSFHTTSNFCAGIFDIVNSVVNFFVNSVIVYILKVSLYL